MRHGKPRRRAFTGLPILQTVRRPGPEGRLLVSPESLTIPYTGGSGTFTVRSDRNWRVSLF